MNDPMGIYHLIFELASDALVVVKKNKIVLCNNKTCAIFGYDKDEFINQSFEALSDLSQNLLSWSAMLALGIETFEWCFLDKNNKSFFLEVTYGAIEYEEEAYVLFTLKTSSERLIASEDRFKQLVEHIKEVFWIHDLELSKILYVSPMYEKIWGNSCSSLYKHPKQLNESIYTEDLERVQVAYNLMKGSFCDFKEEYRINRADGSIRWIWARMFPVKNLEGQVYRIVGIAEDITVRKNLEEELLFWATKDSLTGINNRKSFFGQVEDLIEASKELKNPATLLMMDIDWYKSINDTYGHSVGDLVLKMFVDICNSRLRPDDVFGRIGGEEFAILLPNTTVKSGMMVAERIRKSIEDAKFGGGKDYSIHVTVSIGVTAVLPEEANSDEALVRADQALYKAKQMGRNQVATLDY